MTERSAPRRPIDRVHAGMRVLDVDRYVAADQIAEVDDVMVLLRVGRDLLITQR